MGKINTVRREGGSRVVAIDSIPKDWRYVEISTTKKSDDSLTIKINKVR